MYKIGRSSAKELIEQSDFGYIMVGDVEAVPTLGKVKPSEKKYKVEVDVYQFGDPKDPNREEES